MIQRIALALVVVVVSGLLLVGLIGPALVGLNVPVASTAGTFCVSYGWVLAVLGGIWYFFTGWRPRPR